MGLPGMDPEYLFGCRESITPWFRDEARRYAVMGIRDGNGSGRLGEFRSVTGVVSMSGIDVASRGILQSDASGARRIPAFGQKLAIALQLLKLPKGAQGRMRRAGVSYSLKRSVQDRQPRRRGEERRGREGDVGWTGIWCFVGRRRGSACARRAAVHSGGVCVGSVAGPTEKQCFLERQRGTTSGRRGHSNACES